MKSQLTVIMSVRNQDKYLKASIESILSQTLENFSFIIVDDASGKKTKQILNSIKDKRVKIITNPHRLGLAKSLNIAIAASKSDYIARMDADDIAAKARLKTQLDFLVTHPQLAGCGSIVTLINLHGKNLGIKKLPLTYQQVKSTIMRCSPFIHPTIMLKKSIYKDLGGYNEKLNGAEDYDLWLKIIPKHQMINLNKPLLNYRINPQGVSWSNLKHTEAQAIKARLKALVAYGYPKWQAIYLIKPILSFLIPGFFKKKLFNIS